MDGVSVGIGAVALVLAGVWVVARYGERLAPLPYRTDPVLRRVGRCLRYGLLGAVLLVSGREMRRDQPTA